MEREAEQAREGKLPATWSVIIAWFYHRHRTLKWPFSGPIHTKEYSLKIWLGTVVSVCVCGREIEWQVWGLKEHQIINAYTQTRAGELHLCAPGFCRATTLHEFAHPIDLGENRFSILVWFREHNFSVVYYTYTHEQIHSRWRFLATNTLATHCLVL